MDLNLIFYKLLKFALFFVMTYVTLTQSLKHENFSSVLKLIYIISLIFIVVDCYYPTISYE